MKNLPKFVLQFKEPVSFKEEDAYVNFKAGDKVTFNYYEKEDVLIHKTSIKKYTNASQIFIEMKREPVVGDEYTSKIVKMIPLKGPDFEIEPNYTVKFEVIQEVLNNETEK